MAAPSYRRLHTTLLAISILTLGAVVFGYRLASRLPGQKVTRVRAHTLEDVAREILLRPFGKIRAPDPVRFTRQENSPSAIFDAAGQLCGELLAIRPGLELEYLRLYRRASPYPHPPESGFELVVSDAAIAGSTTARQFQVLSDESGQVYWKWLEGKDRVLETHALQLAGTELPRKIADSEALDSFYNLEIWQAMPRDATATVPVYRTSDREDAKVSPLIGAGTPERSGWTPWRPSRPEPLARERFGD